MYNNQQPVFPVDRLLMQPVQYDPNRPPFVPNIQITREFQPYLPYITGFLMDLITKGAQGPISVHFYNHMVQGNPQQMQFNPWVNEDFVREVHNCADFCYLKTFAAGQPVDPGQAIVRLAPAYLSLRAMYELKLFQNLWAFVDPADQQGMQQTIYQFEQEMAAIMALRNGTLPPSGAQVQVGAPMVSGRPASYPQPVGPQMGGYQQAAPMMGQPSAAYTAPVGMGGSRGPGGGRDYGNTAPTQAAAMPQPAPVAATMPQTTTPAAAQPQGAAMSNEQMVEASTTQWKALMDGPNAMPYPIAYNPVTTKMYYRIENGKTIPVPAKNEIDMINYDRHNIVTLFGHVPDNMPAVKDNGELTRGLAQSVRDAEAEAENVDQQGERLEEAMGLRAILTSSSLETAIQDVRTEMLLKIDRAHPPMVFQAYAQIYTPIIGAEPEYELLRKFADSSSYIELREKIRSAGGTASPELLTEVILRFTGLMNTILHKQLSILPSDILVDDFVQDLDSLLDLLKKHPYSENVQKAFLKDQSLRIKQLLGFPDTTTESGQELQAALTENALTAGWDDREDKPAFTFFGPTVRLSILNVLSHDLVLSGLAQIGNILTKQQFPALFDLAHQVFNADNNGQLVARQLVVTLDGRILELFEANLVKGGYLISLVK